MGSGWGGGTIGRSWSGSGSWSFVPGTLWGASRRRLCGWEALDRGPETVALMGERMLNGSGVLETYDARAGAKPAAGDGWMRTNDGI